jgi:peptidoglycan/LPS O-acetylase OafA/YrhL
MAAFIVLLFHFGPEAFGTVIPELRSPWIFPLINGYRAVAIFFVLSGDALASASVHDGDMLGVVRLTLRRYVRLTLPIGFSCVLAFALMKLGLVFNRAAGDLVANPTWLGAFLGFTPSLSSLARYILSDVYSFYPTATPYNAFLWTMAIELSGSGLVFLLCFVLPTLRYPLLVTTVLAATMLYFETVFALFVVGVVLAQLRARGVIAWLRRSRTAALLTFLGFVGVYLFDATVPIRFDRYTHVNRLVTIVTVFCLYACAPYAWLFRTRVARFLGTLSFPIYLAQLPVLVSLESWLVLRYYRPGDPGARGALFACIAAGVVATVLLALVLRSLERALVPPVERQALRLMK